MGEVSRITTGDCASKADAMGCREMLMEERVRAQAAPDDDDGLGVSMADVEAILEAKGAMKISITYGQFDGPTNFGWRATCDKFPRYVGRHETADGALSILLDACNLCAACGCIEMAWDKAPRGIANQCSNCGETRVA